MGRGGGVGGCGGRVAVIDCGRGAAAELNQACQDYVLCLLRVCLIIRGPCYAGSGTSAISRSRVHEAAGKQTGSCIINTATLWANRMQFLSTTHLSKVGADVQTRVRQQHQFRISCPECLCFIHPVAANCPPDNGPVRCSMFHTHITHGWKKACPDFLNPQA